MIKYLWIRAEENYTFFFTWFSSEYHLKANHRSFLEKKVKTHFMIQDIEEMEKTKYIW